MNQVVSTFVGGLTAENTSTEGFRAMGLTLPLFWAEDWLKKRLCGHLWGDSSFNGNVKSSTPEYLGSPFSASDKRIRLMAEYRETCKICGKTRTKWYVARDRLTKEDLKDIVFVTEEDTDE